MKTLILAILSLSLTNGLFASLDEMQLKLRIQAADGNLDQTDIYFAPNVTPVYSALGDAPKVFSAIPGVPVIYSLTSDKVNCSILGYSDLSQSAVIDLGVITDSSGIFTLSMLSLSNFDATTIITFEDRQLNVFTDLRTNFYQVRINTGDSATGRFFLHVVKAVQYNTTTADCSNQNGMITLFTDSSIKWDLCQLYDSGSNLLGKYANIGGQFSFPALKEGYYKVTLTYQSFDATLNIQVNGNYVKVVIAASTNSAAIGEEINFSSVTTNATKFDWSFGDGTLVTGVANPTLLYYIPGDFTVNLNCSNDSGCSGSSQFAMNVTVSTGINDLNNKNISIISQNKTVTVNMNEVAFNGAEMQVFSLLGQMVYSSVISNTTTVLNFSGQASGYYVVTIRNAGKANVQKIYVSN